MSSLKVKCNECGWKGLDIDALEAANPFSPQDIIAGCPECKSVDTLDVVCDELGCWQLANCGTPTDNGYRTTCNKHSPK